MSGSDMTAPSSDVNRHVALEACPFCGNPDVGRDEGCFPLDRNHKIWEVRCGNPSCFAHEASGATREEAIAKWNRRALRQGGWMPIETAPKDGNPVLIAGGVFDVYDHESLAMTGVSIAYWDKHRQEWHGDEANAHDEYKTHRPTCWQPLIAPPSPAPAGKETK